MKFSISIKKHNMLLASFIIILCFCITSCKPKISTDSPNSPNKIIDILSLAKIYIFKIFVGLEDYIVKFHQYILKDLNVEYPFDLIVFTLIGMIIFYLCSLINFKREYVYNYPDQPDLGALINNKLKELTSLSKSAQITQTHKSENQLEKEILSETSSSDLNTIRDKVQNLSNELTNIEGQIKLSKIINFKLFIDFTTLDEYLKTISNSQDDISNSLSEEQNGELTPNGEQTSGI